MNVRVDREGIWELRPNNDYWLPVGYIPRRTTRFGWFVYHVVHGLWMRYPWWKVVIFALMWTNPGEDDVRQRYWEG